MIHGYQWADLILFYCTSICESTLYLKHYTLPRAKKPKDHLFSKTHIHNSPFPLAPFPALLQQFAMGNAQSIRLLVFGIGVRPHDPELTADAAGRNPELIIWKPPLHVLQDWNHLLSFLGVVRPSEATFFAKACFFAVQGAYRDPLSLSRVALDCAAQ